MQSSPDAESEQPENAFQFTGYECPSQFSVDKDFRDNCMGTIKGENCNKLTNEMLQKILTTFFQPSDRVETTINYVANLNMVDIAEVVADIFTGHPGEGRPEAIQEYFTGTYNAMVKSVPEKPVDLLLFGENNPRHPKYLFRISRFLMNLCIK